MSQSKESRKIILIVDDDLGFLTRLGLGLATHGFISIPALGVEPAQQAIEDLDLTIDLAIVNLALQGMVELIHGLRHQAPKLRVIAIQDTMTSTTSSGAADASHPRSTIGWLTLVRRLLRLAEAANV